MQAGTAVEHYMLSLYARSRRHIPLETTGAGRPTQVGRSRAMLSPSSAPPSANSTLSHSPEPHRRVYILEAA